MELIGISAEERKAQKAGKQGIDKRKKTFGKVDISTRFLYNTVIAQGSKTSLLSTGKHRIQSEVNGNGSFWYAPEKRVISINKGHNLTQKIKIEIKSDHTVSDDYGKKGNVETWKQRKTYSHMPD